MLIFQGVDRKFVQNCWHFLYRNPNFPCVFLSLGGHEKTSQKIPSPKKATFKLADIPTKWSLEVPQKGNQEIKPPNSDLLIFLGDIFYGKKRSHGMKITMKNPAFMGNMFGIFSKHQDSQLLAKLWGDFQVSSSLARGWYTGGVEFLWFVVCWFVFEQGRFPRKLFPNKKYCINHASLCWKLVGFEGD